MTWTRGNHAEARMLAREQPAGTLTIAYIAMLRLTLGAALDEIERLNRELERIWAIEGVTPTPEFPLANGLRVAKEGT